MTEILDYFANNWGSIVSVSAAIAATSVFIRNILTIQKLRLEIRKLKNEENSSKPDKSMRIKVASLEEIEKYNSKFRDGLRVLRADSPGLIETMLEKFGMVACTSLLSGMLLVSLVLTDSDYLIKNLLVAVALFAFTASSLTLLLDKTITRRLIERLENDASKL